MSTFSLTQEQVEELQCQAQADRPPPGPPKRTAVATDEPEKRPCKYCGHTQVDHMGPKCRGGVVGGMTYTRVPTYSMGGISDVMGLEIQTSSATCLCPAYEPKI